MSLQNSLERYACKTVAKQTGIYLSKNVITIIYTCFYNFLFNEYVETCSKAQNLTSKKCTWVLCQ